MNLPTLRHTVVIGVGHRARQGKDTAARALEAIGGGRVRRFAFSDGIAMLCRIRDGMTGRDGHLLQRVGAAARQDVDPDVWVRTVAWAIADWDADADRKQVAVIAGLRYPNEAEMVQQLGGHLLRVRRFVAGVPYVPTDRDPAHVTEEALADFPWPNTIDNDDGDLLGFTLAVQALGATLVPEVFKVHKPKPLVYISGPITPSGERTIEANVEQAKAVYLRFVAAGVPAYCPHVGGYHPEFHAVEWETWMRYDLAVLEQCGAVLTLPEWEHSKGAIREVSHAITLGIPVFHREEEALAFARR